jgi:hypothetical protein
MNLLRSIEGRAEGDPKKIASVVVQLAKSSEGPARLILGVDAKKRVKRAEEARTGEAAKWHHVTISTVFEEAGPIPGLLDH